MAKIRKNLSDEDMLKGFSEELSFENGIYSEEKTSARMKLKAKAPAPANIAARPSPAKSQGLKLSPVCGSFGSVGLLVIFSV